MAIIPALVEGVEISAEVVEAVELSAELAPWLQKIPSFSNAWTWALWATIGKGEEPWEEYALEKATEEAAAIAYDAVTEPEVHYEGVYRAFGPWEKTEEPIPKRTEKIPGIGQELFQSEAMSEKYPDSFPPEGTDEPID